MGHKVWTRTPGHLSQLGVSPGEEKGSISRLKGWHWGDTRLPSPKLVSSPEVPFVGGILDVVANIVEHPVSRGAVSGIEHLEEVHCGIGGPFHPSSAPQGLLPIGREPRAHAGCCPTGGMSISLLHQTRKNLPQSQHAV